MTKILLHIRTLLVLSFAAVAMSVPAAAQDQAKWFVLRDHEISSCWTQLLIRVGGEYRHGFAQTAGGPYNTQEEALAREKALHETGTCQP